MPIPFLNSINLTKNQVENFCIYNVANDPTGSLTVAGDYGYFWLNTTSSGGVIPTLKWWDGANVRSLVDSTNIGSFTSGLATDLAGGGAGQIVYQDGANDTKFLAAGTAGQVLSSNAASAPSWVNQSSLSAGSAATATKATDVAGGAAGKLLYQTAVDDTDFLAVGTNGQVLTSSGTGPQWTNQSSLAAGTAANISGGLAGQLLYQSALATTAKLTIGTAGQALVVNAGATAPEWVDQSTLSVGSATNKPGGSVGDILVQSGSGSTGFLNAGANGQVITSNGLSPQYVNQSTLSVGSATTSGTATNIAGGAANRIPYQTAAGTTAFITDAANSILTTNASSVPALTAAISVTVGKAVDIALGAAGDLLYQSASNDTSFLNIGANGSILTSTGTAPQWSASIPSGSVSGLAASATTDTTNASNISSGTLGLARLSLASGQFYVGDGSNNPAATAKSSIPLSGFGAAGANVAMGGFKITGLGTPTASTDAATMGYVDSVAQGLDVKASCLVATTADITLASPGAVTIDGIYSATDFTAGTTRILVKDQSAPAENGIYIWQGPAAAMTRSADADTWDELVGAFTFIERGTANADSGWVCSVNAGGTLGSTAVTWVKFSQAGSYTQGRGMVLDGTAFNFAQNTNYTADTIPYASGATTIGFIGAGTADQVLRVPGAGGTPAFGAIDLTKSASVTGALPAANGGTGQSSYSVGDILFADSATSLAKLADVATGNALISGGVTTAPSWGKIGLTTHVSGTLPVGNGGTGASTFTAGRILFGNGTNAIATSSSLNWDSSNNRLGIGTGTPGYEVDVVAPAGVGVQIYENSTTTNKRLRITQQTDHASYDATFTSGGNAHKWKTGGTERFAIDGNGIATWSNVGGVADTAMTLNATGLGVGVSPLARVHSVSNIAAANHDWTSQFVAPTVGFLAASNDSSAWIRIATYNSNPTHDPYLNFLTSGGQNWSIGIDNSDSDKLKVAMAAGFSGSNEFLAIDSTGNVGIGTTTPNRKLEVAAGTGGAALRLTNTNGNSGIEILTASDKTSWRIGAQYNVDQAFEITPSTAVGGTTFSTPAVVVTSSGNLGLGVTPSAWVAGSKAIQIGSYTAVSEATGGDSNITSNAYLQAANTYKALITAGSSRYQSDFGTHRWWVNSTTNAGQTIAFTQAMTLDASGRLLIGGTSTYDFAGQANLVVNGTSNNATLTIASTGIGYIAFADGTTGTSRYVGRIDYDHGTDEMFLTTNAVERLIIKKHGQVNFRGLASDPAGAAAGDVYYNSGSNLFRVYDTGWKTLPRKYVVQLSDGSVTVVGNAYTITHNLGSQDVTVSIRRTTDNAVVQADVVMPAGGNTVTVTFAAAITAAQFYVTVIG